MSCPVLSFLLLSFLSMKTNLLISKINGKREKWRWKWSRVACSQSLYFLFLALPVRSCALSNCRKKKVKTSVDRLDYLVISAYYMYFKVFRYSFSEAIPIFFKSVFFFLSDHHKIFTSNWRWIEICENVVLSKIDITMTTINKQDHINIMNYAASP